VEGHDLTAADGEDVREVAPNKPASKAGFSSAQSPTKKPLATDQRPSGKNV
jgi:hypothetical protein